ncbi:uncharacterized protein TNCV_3522191 [Trichonephila clavipes]|uniref:Transposase Tc1-like domain-containing protein n=1 Tax=Trichonephila clavipes TaxID=2585209 RepID=A0A8X6W9Y0_TRICX|nr:uncharacterized protein TNCV_3522191 [Trichonephila clavipes]
MMPSTDQSLRRPPHYNKCTHTANCFIGRHPGTGNTLTTRGSCVSRTMRRRLAEGHLGSRRPLPVLPLTPTHQSLRLEWCRARRNWTVVEWNQVVFSDESRFKLTSDDNRVRVWRLRGERLNLAFALQRHTAPTTVVGCHCLKYMVTSSIGPWHHDILLPLMQWLPGTMNHFSTRQCRASHDKGVTKLFTHCYYPSLACSIPRFVFSQAYLDRLGLRVGHSRV